MPTAADRPQRIRMPVKRIRSSDLASVSSQQSSPSKGAESASRNQTPRKSKTVKSKNSNGAGQDCWTPGKLVWAVRSFDPPSRTAAGPWPAIVVAPGTGIKNEVIVRFLGEGEGEASQGVTVNADQLQDFDSPDGVAHFKRSRTAAFKAALEEASSLSIVSGSKRLYAAREEGKQNAEEGQKITKKRQKKSSTVEESDAVKLQEAASQRPVKQELKEESQDECEAAGEEEISDYEKLRQANMSRNKQILDMLELPSVPAGDAAMVAVRARGLKGTRKTQEVLPSRDRSLRVQGKKPDGKQLELPADWREPIRFNPSSKKESGGRSSLGSGGGEDEVSSRRTGDLAASECVLKDSWADDPEAPLAAARAQTAALLHKIRDTCTSGASVPESRDTKVSERAVVDLQALQVAETDVAKVCPHRIASIAFHPSADHVVVAAGDKRGKIGFFTPDWTSDDSCVTLLDVHSSSVTWLAFDKTAPNALYSSSYDNIVRRLDLEKQVFTEILSLEENQWNFLSTSHLDSGAQMVRCGFGTGHMHMVDVRGGRANTVQLHAKTIRSIDVSPGNSNLIVTGSIDHYARIWDIRKLKRTEPLAEVKHTQGVTQARFGQGSGAVVMTTSYDDTCKVLEVDSGKVLHTMRHNNSTGRWLSAFQAVFVPGSDSVCSIGSMEQHRGIDLLDVAKGSRVARLTSPAYNGITSVNAWHPTRALLVGGNSSGKVYLWR